CWAFDVEALVKPERFQVIKPASQKARDGINRAIAAGSRVVRNAVNIDEAALKSALRSLANSSQVRQEAVETIINGLNNKDVTCEYWHSLFNAQGTDRAIKEKIYSPQIVRLMTLRALVIPETLPEFLQWLNIQKGSNVDGNQRVSLELQKKIQPLFPEEQIGAGITYLLPSLLGGKISVDGLCRLLAKSGGDTIWAYGRNQFINNIKYDLQLIYNYYSKPIVGLFDESTLKCGAEAWRSLINRWQDIQRMYKKCEKYRPLAQLFERFKEYDLAGYFYQVTDGFVKKDLFYEIAEAQNRPSPVIYGLGIKKELTLEDIIIGLADGVVKFFNQEEFRKDLGLIESKSLAKKEVLTVKQSEPQKKESIKAEKSVESEVIPSRYTKLETLLKAQNFREADEETRSVMLAVANRQSEGYLRLEDAENFPCKELRTIDNLWLKYSQGKFGISVQQEIYKNLGGTKFYDSDIWESFGERVGWRKQGSWLYYSDLNFSLSAPTGHLPAAGGGTLIEEEAFARFTLISRKKCLGGARGRGRGRWGVVL
ncbi:GUN4 domain-containing protein, partial [Cylindrospermopsis raciborskii]